MDTKKVKKTPSAQTPKSAKKNDKSVKTPVTKGTPMADTPRPVLSAKKQNGLQSAGKATPNKKGNATPNKKTPKSESKKKGKKPEKKVEEDEEDDDEEDDSEIELNPEIMKSLAEMSDDDDEDMSDDEEDMSDDDDDDEEDDDEDDDDDDDDEEDDDEIDSEVENEIQSLDEEQLKQLIKSLKGKDKQEKKSKNGIKETAAKEKKGKEAPAAAEAPKKETKAKAPAAKKETPAPKAAKKETEKEAPAAAAADTSVDKEEYIKSVSERDLRTLFLKGLPVAIQEEDIMKLSKDIKSVRIRKRIRRNHKHTACYAFVEFENEAAAENNFKLLSETVLEEKPITVDYMGSKSLHRPKKPGVVKELDPKKLYITGFPYTTTETEIRQLFPKADSFVMPIKRTSKKPLGFAFAKFESSEVCADEMKRLNGYSFKDCKLVVVNANLVTDTPKTKGVKRKTETVTGKSKKAKLEKAKKDEEEEEDDDEDDDDEEEDDDDDDEEEDDDDEEEEEDDDDDDE